MKRLFSRLLRDKRGTSLIETALVTPIMLVLSLGSFQVSEVVARQHELDTGADQATALVQAGWTNPTQQAAALKAMLQASLGLSASQIVIASKYRCGITATYVDVAGSCAVGTIQATILQIRLTDRYTPTWTDFGVGSPIDLSVQRMVQVS